MKHYIYILLFLFPLHLLGQGTIGVDELEPETTMNITTKDVDNPESSEGIIIPRVTDLNITDPKEVGLLVFYETSTLDRGFYWWDGVTWQPFVSITQVSADLTIAHAYCKNTFKEGIINENASTDLRTIEFDGLETNDVANYEINTAGELVVKKAGKYHVYGVVNVRNTSSVTNANKRDAIEAKLYVNGANASAVNGNLNIEGANSFPTGNNSVVVFLSGSLILDANDRLIFKVNRYYRDSDTPISISPDPSALSNLTLKYLGPQ